MRQVVLAQIPYLGTSIKLFGILHRYCYDWLQYGSLSRSNLLSRKGCGVQENWRVAGRIWLVVEGLPLIMLAGFYPMIFLAMPLNIGLLLL